MEQGGRVREKARMRLDVEDATETEGERVKTRREMEAGRRKRLRRE